MGADHDPADAIGTVTHFFGHLSVAAISLKAPLAVGERCHIRGHTTDLEQTIETMQIEHQAVESAGPGDDVAIGVKDHVREGDLIFRES
jgi:hypothetical protein